MLSKEENLKLTLVGPGTPAGTLMRDYWQPAALVEELSSQRPLVPVRLFGEDLVLFRDELSNYGLIDRHCPHRGADLCYGRLEDGGLRCSFHGWLFAADGQCLEQPAEPEGSTYHSRIRQRAYPCKERNGIVFAWMSEVEPPPLPELDCLLAADEYTFAFKGLWQCNWLQALEVALDPAHASWLHRYLDEDDMDASYGQQFRDTAADTDIPLTRILREYPRPQIDVTETGYGLRIVTTREMDDGRAHVRVTNQVFPQTVVISMSREMTITQWHVPVDDYNCYWYALFTSYGNVVDKARMREQRLATIDLPDYRSKLGRSNGWGYDVDDQQRHTYTGMGVDINVHDQWAVESPGKLQDRSREHLGYTDVVIRTNRRRLSRSIEHREDSAPAVNACVEEKAKSGDNPSIAIDAIVARGDDRECWRAVAEQRREKARWPLRSDQSVAGSVADGNSN